jgi:hypothetical protein
MAILFVGSDGASSRASTPEILRLGGYRANPGSCPFSLFALTWKTQDTELGLPSSESWQLEKAGGGTCHPHRRSRLFLHFPLSTMHLPPLRLSPSRAVKQSKLSMFLSPGSKS